MIVYASRPHYLRHLAGVADALGATVITGVQKLPKGSEPVLVAAGGDLDRVGGSHPVALMEHGAGQRYVGLCHRSWAGGSGRQNVSLFLCPRQDVVDANLSVYPDAVGVVVGCPALDVYADRRKVRGSPPVVAFTFHPDYPAAKSVPELRSAFRHYDGHLGGIVSQLRAEGCRVVGHWHPRFRTLRNLWRVLGVEGWEHWPSLLAEVDVLVADNTSALPEAAAVGAGTVYLSAPWYRRDVTHGGRFWEWPRFGTPADIPSEVVSAVLTELSRPPGCTQQEAIQAVYGGVRLGSATRLAVEAVRGWAG